MRGLVRWRSAAIVALLASGLGSASIEAAPPKVNFLYPPGGQRGTSVDVTASGEFGNWPVQVWSDQPGVSAKAEADKGKLTVTIAADAAPGVAWLRLYDAEGASVVRPFIVGTLAETLEVEPNDSPDKPQTVAAGTVVTGKLQKGGDHDGYAITLKQGETLVAALQANSVLGSPVDAVLQLCEVTEHRVLSDAPPLVETYVLEQNHDAHGLDPRVVFTAPRDGTYLVRVFGFPSQPNATIAYAGGDDYIYRLTLTTGGYVAAALPLAIGPEPSGELRLLGWNLTDATQRAPLPAAGAPLSAFHVDAAGSIPLLRSPYPTLVAEEPAAGAPQEVTLPIAISGQLATPGDRDTFRFPAVKGKKIRLEVTANLLGYPIDPHLAISDESGKVLVENDDAQREKDAQLVFTPPADGFYLATVRDLSRSGGLAHVYQLTIAEVAADFRVTVAEESFVLTREKPLEINVAIDRRDGMSEPIVVRAVDLPAGVTAEEVVSEPQGESAKAVKLVLKLGEEAKEPFSGIFHIEGASKSDTPITRQATFRPALPLAPEMDSAWLTVRP